MKTRMLTLFMFLSFLGTLLPLSAQGSGKEGPSLTIEKLFENDPESLQVAQFAYNQLGFVIKGSNLSGDITVGVEGTQPEAITLGKTILSKDKVESTSGDTLYVGLRTLSELASSATLSFSGGATASQNLAWTTIPITTTTIADLYASGQEGTYYHLQDLTISYMESESVFYLQNGEYGIKLNDGLYGYLTIFGRSYKQGDKIDHIICEYAPGGMSASYIMPVADPGPASAHDQNVEPTTLTLEDLKANKAKYVSSLVKIENVEFYNTGDEGTTFPASAKNFSIRQNQDQTTFKARTLNASFADEKVPATATIVGIVTAPSGTIVGMRSTDDIINPTYPVEGQISIEPFYDLELDKLQVYPFAYNQLGFVIKGSNLSGDITVGVEGTQPEAITLSKNTLSQEKLESSEGDTLFLSIFTESEQASSATLSFSGGATASQNLAWTTIPVTTTTIADLYASGQEGTYYHLQDLTISYMESESVFYLQNGEYGIKLNDEYESFVYLGRSYKQGDKIDHIICEYAPGGMSASYIMPVADPGPASAQNQTVEPTTLTLEDLKANKTKYVSSLVKIENVEFYNTGDEGTTFPASAKNFSIRQNQDQTTFKARTLNSSFADEKVPATATIVGIVTAPSGTIVGMRSPDDILNATYPGDPDPEPEPEPEPGTDLIAGENILLNAGFEKWGTPSDFNPDGDIQEWNIAMGYSKETTIIKEGSSALRIENAKGLPSLYQSIGSALNPIFTPGDTYRMTVWYYVETSDEGQDVSIASYWNGSASMGKLTHDEAVLNNGEYFTSVGQWSKKEILTTVPEGAVSFEFRLKFSQKASIIFDSFAFCKMTDPNAPAEIKVLPEVLQAFQAAPGKADSTNLTIEGINLKENIKVEFLGTDAELFGSSAPTVANDGNPHQIKIYYRPTKAGEHQAQVMLSSKDADTVKIDLNGKCVEVGEPTITVNTSDLTAFTAKLGKKMDQTVLVSASNMTDYVLVKREGEGMAHFKISTTFIGKNFTNSPVVITYEPTEEGKHQADIVFYSVNDKESVTVKVSGTCTSFEAGWHETFETMEEVSSYGNIYAEADQGMYHLVNAITAKTEDDIFEGKQGLLLGQIPAYVEMDFDILDSVQNFSFMAAAGKNAEEPILYGVYVSTDFGLNWKMLGDTLRTAGAGVKDNPVMEINLNKPVRLRIEKFSGNADQHLYIDNLQMQNSPARTPELDEVLNLDTENPLSLLNESFTNARHNKAVALEGWKNILLKGQRPWWTYQHKDLIADTVVDYSAKATAFLSTSNQKEDYEMWMVTPALDGSNTESNMFTFRVMGDFLPEKDTVNTFELYYIEKDEEGYYKQKIEVDMPSIKDHNGEWREFHIDLKNSEIADVFFMAFRFAAPGGKENASVFYIDDVSYGRTDLPAIEVDFDRISFSAEQYVVKQSDTITVKGLNLTDPISISFTGNNPSNFDANVDAVPAEGGKFVINFLSFEAGIHSAYLRLSSKGAADKYIPVEVNVAQGVPTIIVAGRDLKQELTVEEGQNHAISDAIIVNGLLLTDSIYLSLEGEGAQYFELSRNIMRGDNYNDFFTITFTPGTIKEADAIVRLRSEGANDVLITVKGINENNVAVENTEDFHLQVWQNSDVVYVKADRMKQIRLFSLQGREVMKQHLGGLSQTQFYTQNLPSGVYILQVTSQQGSRQVKLIL